MSKILRELLFYSCLSFLSLNSVSSVVFARGQTFADTARALSVGSGVAAPSATTALFENPAGLVYNDRIRIQANGASNNSSLDPLGLGGGAYLGNGWVGAGIQAVTATGRNTSLRYGAGAYIDALRLAVGIAGGSAIASSTLRNPPGTSHSVNAGAIFNPYGDISVGATAYGLDNNISAVSGGVSTNLSHGATLALDATTRSDFKGLVVKPGLSVWLSSFQLSYSYGYRVDKNAPAYTPLESTVGLGLAVSDFAHLQAYYNQYAKYAAALTLKF
jgi:hypothetical protein